MKLTNFGGLQEIVKKVHEYSCVYCRNQKLTKILFKYGSCDNCYFLMHSVLRTLKLMPDYMFNHDSVQEAIIKKFSALNPDKLNTVVPDVFKHVTDRKNKSGINF